MYYISLASILTVALLYLIILAYFLRKTIAHFKTLTELPARRPVALRLLLLIPLLFICRILVPNIKNSILIAVTLLSVTFLFYDWLHYRAIRRIGGNTENLIIHCLIESVTAVLVVASVAI